MRRTHLFLPTLKDVPSEAQIISHRLMLRAGMVQQVSAGIYSWLPLGLRVLKKIERIVREEQDRAGAQEVLMPTVQSADLWRRSGRYDDYGPEMLRIRDRHERDMLYGPTNEEQITEIFATHVRSYRDLPKMLYHIQWKFRDEVRPRFGVMRGREFLMKDNYSFDLDFESACLSYNRMFVSYLRTFARLGLKAVPMEAESGPIGGNLSHEFLILADTGESSVYCDRDCVEFDMLAREVNYENPKMVQAVVEDFTRPYARTDEKHDAAAFEAAVPPERRYVGRGIEVGHIFYFGAKYSEPLGARVTTAGGGEVAVHMGSYGVGISRLVGAIIEASHDEQGIVWPESVTPYGAGIINLRQGDSRCDGACEDIYAKLFHREPLYDDRPERAGVKFADMDLIGLPWQVVVGPRGIDRGRVELKCRATGAREEISLESALARLA